MWRPHSTLKASCRSCSAQASILWLTGAALTNCPTAAAAVLTAGRPCVGTSFRSTTIPQPRFHHPHPRPTSSAPNPFAATMSSDEDAGDAAVGPVFLHCGAGHPLQLPSALHDRIAARFAVSLYGPPPDDDTDARPPGPVRVRPPRSRPRRSRARRPPIAQQSSSELSSENGPTNLFNDNVEDEADGAGGGDAGSAGEGVGGGGSDDGGAGGGAGADSGSGHAAAAAPAAGAAAGAAARHTAAADEPEIRSGALAAVDRYADLMAVELAVLLSGEVRTEGSLSPIYRLAAVGRGAAVVVGEGERAVVVWLTRSRGRVIYLCSCGGRSGAEPLEVREWMSKSTNWLHARALRIAASLSMVHLNEPSMDGLLQRHSVLENSSAPATSERQVFYATKTLKKRGIFAVLCSGWWSAVSVRPRVGKKSAKRGRVMRAACTRLSCHDHWLCKHAKASTNGVRRHDWRPSWQVVPAPPCSSKTRTFCSLSRWARSGGYL